MIDAVDATLARSLARWESGTSVPLPLADLEVTDWFALTEVERRLLEKRPVHADLDWLELSVAGMLAGVIDKVGVDWAAEAATHIAGILVVRSARVEQHALVWGCGVPVTGTVLGVLTEGFPHPGLA